MPNAKTHRRAGVGAGLVVAAYRGRRQPAPALALEAAGGAIGGYVGAMLPDVLEPATNSWHRQFCHSYSAVAGVSIVVDDLLTVWEGACRSRSQLEWQRFQQQGFTLEGLWHLLLAALTRVAAGVLTGVAAGYGMHLLQDSLTPRGLPVVGLQGLLA